MFYSHRRENRVGRRRTLFGRGTQGFLLRGARYRALCSNEFSSSEFASGRQVILLATTRSLHRAFGLTFTARGQIRLTFFNDPHRICTRVIRREDVVKQLSKYDLYDQDQADSPDAKKTKRVRVFFVLFVVLNRSRSHVQVNQFRQGLFGCDLVVRPIFFRGDYDGVITVFRSDRRCVFHVNDYAFRRAHFGRARLRCLDHRQKRKRFDIQRRDVILNVL